MKRVAKIKQRNSGKTRPPSRFIFFDTETGRRKLEHREGATTLPLKLGAAIYVNTNTVDGIPYEERFEFTSSDEFWDFVESKTVDGKVLWVFAHNINFDLSVTEWHHQLYTKRGWCVKKSILPDGAPIPFVVEWQPHDQINNKKLKYKRTIKLVDSANYMGLTSLEKLGQSVGIAKMKDVVDYQKEPDRWFDAQPGTPDWDILRTYCMRDVEVLQAVVMTFIKFVEKYQLGSFAISAAGQAMNAYTHLFMPDESIYIHNHPQTLKLERESYMGARVELLNKQGETRDSIREFDINSMYPFIMSKRIIPSQRIRSAHTPEKCARELPIDTIIPLINDRYCLICRVDVEIPMGDEPIIPLKYEGKLIYPTGKFEAVLTTPELKKAVQLGYVKKVKEYALYEGREDLFSEFVEFFYEKRFEYGDAGNAAFAAMCKLFLNSLYGKFGQFTYEWHPVKDDRDGHLTMFDVLGVGPGQIGVAKDVDTGEIIKYRNIGGKLEVRDNIKIEPPESFCAIASHIIAYGRSYLTELIELAGGRKNVLYCDTDSLHVIGDAHLRLAAAGMLDNRELGKLKQEVHMGLDENGTPIPSSFGNYRAPKDYHLEGKGNKTKGVRKGSLEIGGVGSGVFEVDQFRGFNGSLRDGDLNSIMVEKRVKRATGKYTKAFVEAETGLIEPWHMHEGRAISTQEYLTTAL